MAEQQEYIFPRWYFSPSEPQGRLFHTKEEFDAAGGQSTWYFTPQEATEARDRDAQQQAADVARAAEPPHEGEGGPPPRPTSRR